MPDHRQVVVFLFVKDDLHGLQALAAARLARYLLHGITAVV
jgi:hypothetical protein